MNNSLQGVNNLAPFNAGTMRERKFLAIRYEGYNDWNVSPGSSNSIYEIYMFADGWTELRIGNWSSGYGIRGSTNQDIAGLYDSNGIGYSFPSFGANMCYTFWRSGDPWLSNFLNPTYLFTNHIYQKGEFISTNSSGDRNPIEGAAATPSTSWPPAGWTSILATDTRRKNISLDGSWPSTNVNAAFMDNSDISNPQSLFGFYDFVQPSNIYVSSVSFITFGYISPNSATSVNPSINRIVVGGHIVRSFQQVAWKVGYK